MSENTEACIVRCPSCGQRNRIKNKPRGSIAVCGKCATPLEVTPINSGSTDNRSTSALRVLLNTLLIATLVIIGFGIAVTPRFIKKDFSELYLEETDKTEAMKVKKEEALEKRKTALENELAAIDAGELRRKAEEWYRQELEGRKSYDKRFAISPREKAQLRMLNLASDSTKSFHDAIRAIAREASPQGSDISVGESSQGISLHIDFDMSTMTSGEYGTQTKHHTKDSLSKEVISLISRVTNDIFQFCRAIDIHSIHVGCRHHVQITYPDGTTQDENTILYKIRILKDSIPDLTSNPFLDVYSTTKYFVVEEDNFAGIEIHITRI